MFKKATTVACSLAALLALGCENNETGLEEPDATVTPAETEPLPDDQYVDPLDNTTTEPLDIDDTEPPETPIGDDTTDPAAEDVDVVDEVPAEELPETEQQ